MSDLLSQASLVMIPSGYKEDIVYSPVPTNGNGDLSFTRASNGTRINSAGLVEVTPWNLVGYSEDFSAGWTLIGGGSFTSNAATAPNGTTTADEYDQGGYVRQLFTIPSNYITFTFYVRAKTSSSSFRVGILGVGDSAIAQTVETVGTSWVQMTVTYDNFNESAKGVFFSIQSGDTEVYIWGAQLNIGSTAKPYFPTTDRLNVPRLTYQNGGGGCPSLLLEKQSTNLVSYSQEFTNAYWSKLGQGVGSTSVVTANYAISPDGTQNATRFVCNLNGGTTSSDRSWIFASFTAPATSTLSIWIKLNSAGTKTFVFSDSGGGTKTISGTDWQRIDATFVGAGGEFRIGLIGGSSSDTLDCSIWGAQAESGSYPTSYIPTTSSSATRVADACFKTGISSLIGQTEGVAFVDFNYIATTNTSDTTPIRLLGSGSAGIYLEINSNNTFEVVVVNSVGSLVFNSTSSAQTAGRYKFAIAYNANDYAFYLNGTQIAVDTSGAFASASLDSLNLGMYQSGSQHLDGSINQAVLFTTRLTNSELASLTTL